VAPAFSTGTQRDERHRLANLLFRAQFCTAAAHARSSFYGMLARDLAWIDRQHRGAVLGSMRVLAHMHTMNDEAVVEQLLEALLHQTRPPDAIVVVDNASTDRTLDRTFPENLTVIRNPENLGTSGAIRFGFAHALQHGFDWTWVFDADSVPELDALEKLIAFFERLSPAEQEQVCFLACCLTNAEGEVRHRPMTFVAGSNIEYPSVDLDAACTQCDCFIWTGSLFRMPAVAKIGLPSADYVLDVAEVEYGYRAQQLGLTSYMIHNAVTRQDVGRRPGVVVTRTWSIGRWKFPFREVSPIRTYYASRNLLYFWLYQCRPVRPRRAVRTIVQALIFSMSFVLRPVSHRHQLLASLRGLWDGLTARIERRY
jgi:GT2 family glycosyltransferase